MFTNVPLHETIETIAEKAFVDNWFNVTHNLKITKPDLVQLLEVATTNQLFQFDGKPYEQIDGVVMGSPLGPLVAKAFLCSIEEKLEQKNKLPEYYRRYVDDTLATIKNVPAAEDFLSTLNSCHPSIRLTMELASDDKLPFIGLEVVTCWNIQEVIIVMFPDGLPTTFETEFTKEVSRHFLAEMMLFQRFFFLFNM